MPLPEDVSLRDVAAMHKLDDAREYVIAVFHNLRDTERKRDVEMHVRVGRTGAGRSPHYCVGSVSTHSFGTSFLPLAAFNGRTHKPLLPNVREGEEMDILQKRNWSTTPNSREDVVALMQELAAEKKAQGSR